MIRVEPHITEVENCLVTLLKFFNNLGKGLIYRFVSWKYVGVMLTVIQISEFEIPAAVVVMVIVGG